MLQVAMARNLLKSGQFAKVYVWNRTLSKVGITVLYMMNSTPVQSKSH